jgi:hypothetical protein
MTVMTSMGVRVKQELVENFEIYVECKVCIRFMHMERSFAYQSIPSGSALSWNPETLHLAGTKLTTDKIEHRDVRGKPGGCLLAEAIWLDKR